MSENTLTHKLLNTIGDMFPVIIVTAGLVLFCINITSCTKNANNNYHEETLLKIKLEQTKVDLEMEKVKSGYKIVTTQGIEK